MCFWPMKGKKNLLRMMIIKWLSHFQACPSPLGICQELICHLLGPGSGEFVRKPLLGGGAFVNSSGRD